MEGVFSEASQGHATHLLTHQPFPRHFRLCCQPLHETGTFATTPHHSGTKHEEARRPAQGHAAILKRSPGKVPGLAAAKTGLVFMDVAEMIQAKPTPQGSDEETEAQRGTGPAGTPQPGQAPSTRASSSWAFKANKALACKVPSTDAGAAWTPSSKGSPLP